MKDRQEERALYRNANNERTWCESKPLAMEARMRDESERAWKERKEKKSYQRCRADDASGYTNRKGFL